MKLRVVGPGAEEDLDSTSADVFLARVARHRNSIRNECGVQEHVICQVTPRPGPGHPSPASPRLTVSPLTVPCPRGHRFRKERKAGRTKSDKPGPDYVPLAYVSSHVAERETRSGPGLLSMERKRGQVSVPGDHPRAGNARPLVWGTAERRCM